MNYVLVIIYTLGQLSMTPDQTNRIGNGQIVNEDNRYDTKEECMKDIPRRLAILGISAYSSKKLISVECEERK